MSDWLHIDCALDPGGAAREIVRLRAALEPFANAWRTTLADPYYPLETVVAQDITTDQWRTAAEATDG